METIEIKKILEKYRPLRESYWDAKIIDKEILSLLKELKKDLGEEMCFLFYFNINSYN